MNEDHSSRSLVSASEAVKLGVKSVVIFPKTPDELKTQTAEAGRLVNYIHVLTCQ